jgi:hypothetical protein
MRYFSVFTVLATAFLVAVHATLDHGQTYGGKYVPGMYIIEVSDFKALGGKRNFVSVRGFAVYMNDYCSREFPQAA